ncbi:peroxiredoxin [Cereibacter azotoformans]|uniref:thioredoxin-dependent peroxiredoxin n=1 Tax=Cereibacter azotoformans TaxID=43057 RepID=A0A2T5KBF2_9RHOB|nr:peroxiredoxin [Cereibacter azotoformans]AXQ93771.1 peroxiredoxin [Cereibacter sphaeroides]MBO4168430.1 peroxiredoxin [Cereibacter azotoformans]PTR19745.1 peroxiredoxin Q/BCP [Cereibacter azotoformans]UIJ29284.1 peroxiredoxin [Cereibacter azotoformans]
MIDAGQPAPDFTLPRDGGSTVSLSALKPGKAVVYFYPKDDTSGCTLEAQEFTALAAQFAEIGATVIGISKDSVKSHDRFCAKHGLGIILASDEGASTAEDYGVWKEKNMYGKTYMGIERSTFLIDGEGRIARVWRKVSARGHAAEVLAAAREL